jgi:hypothetical protein
MIYILRRVRRYQREVIRILIEKKKNKRKRTKEKEQKRIVLESTLRYDSISVKVQ